MDADIKENLPTLVVMTLIGIATSAFGLTLVHGNAGSLDVGSFSTLVIVIPCAVMLVMSFAAMLVARRIGQRLFLVVVCICLFTGAIAMVVTSGWMQDDQIAAQLLANSADGATIVPILKSPLVILRDIAAFVVCPTVGCIAGAWTGSRLHPVTSSRKGGGKAKR